ncbi:unnamed protein product [Cylicocyclus nassatus]|uniref:Uncharacterized protein n=1 Tax=Cylicocyclus nassatus TaxID=53992 RepID=A0AA36DQD3_CYLNA|nr:unnamed protein product [Cylicocyclus nassatus]
MDALVSDEKLKNSSKQAQRIEEKLRNLPFKASYELRTALRGSSKVKQVSGLLEPVKFSLISLKNVYQLILRKLRGSGTLFTKSPYIFAEEGKPNPPRRTKESYAQHHCSFRHSIPL